MVISTAGDDFKTSKGGMEWTVGEVMVEFYNVGQVSFSQGFHHPEIIPTGLPGPEGRSAGLRVYPNPVQHRLFLHRNDAGESLQISLIDAAGRLCFSAVWPPDEKAVELDMRPYAAGIYVLLLTDEPSHKSYPYRISKSAFE